MDEEIKIKRGSPVSDLISAGFKMVEDCGTYCRWENGDMIAHETVGYVFDMGEKKKEKREEKK